jgi:hypothetical protein
MTFLNADLAFAADSFLAAKSLNIHTEQSRSLYQ